MAETPPPKRRPKRLPQSPTIAPPAGFDALPAGELVQLLNMLLEAERAGVRVTATYGAEMADPAVGAALHDVGVDEARFCAMLTRHVERLGGAPSKATGAFAGKAAAVAGDAARLDFLNRGQGWVVKRLKEALPRIADATLHTDLADMLEVHERNIARCAGVGEKRD